MRIKDLTEAFTQPYPITWEHGDESHDALAQLPDGNHLSVMFSLDYGAYGDEEWAVEFWRNNSQDVTGEGDAYRIFATVMQAIKEFVEFENPERMRFSATKEVEPDQNSQSRAKLYTTMVRRYASAMGYSVEISDHASSVVYELFRIS